ncbi:MAG TPA: alpha-amylase, partial [Prolixibacteraceae bacterium]|nr:alpha-amylase [Prolixibacteraceae bacterium]
MKWLDLLPLTLLVIFSGSCDQPAKQPAEKANNKIVVYQVFTRLFGNTITTNKPWGTIEENGVGKFNDFTVKALSELKALGITHIWFTGVPHHALVTDYTSFGIPGDDP